MPCTSTRCRPAGPGRGASGRPHCTIRRAPEVERFARARAERVEFFQYLQWLADEQLAQAQERARAAGMPIGLYRDLAIGVAPGGAMTWANPGVAVVGASVGAPPDIHNPLGQNWGLAPFSPVGLRERAYRPFADDVRHNMRHAGAIRIDHAMGLMRLYWIPDGAEPAQGAYVRYPLQDLLRVLALQSDARALPGDRRGPRHGGQRISPDDGARRRAVLSLVVLRAFALGRLSRLPGATLPTP